MSETFGRRRFVGAAAGAIAIGAAAAAGVAALGQEQWFSPAGTADRVRRPLTADPRATPETQALLRWFTSLPSRSSRRVVSGQQLDDFTEASYERLVEQLARRTGKYPAMVGVMVRDEWSRNDTRVLVDHWRAGGLVTMDTHLTNPWDPRGGANSAWMQDARAPKPDLRALLATSDPSEVRTLWRAQLERLGDIIEELAGAGVVVLLRPLHESNGSWFWWGQDLTTRRTSARDLYRDVFYYLTQARDLHNILWVFSPAASWDGAALAYYPGWEYVDMVCPSRYHDDLLLLGDHKGESPYHDYADILSAGKPVGFGECGPDRTLDGSWDARTIINRIRTSYPAMTYFHCWHGWDDKIMELVADRYTEELMNDPWVITRDRVDWRPKNPVSTVNPSRTKTPRPQPSSPPPSPRPAVIRPFTTS